MNFKKHHFEIVKGAIDKNLADFLFDYLKLKKSVLDHMQQTRYLSPYDHSLGRYTDQQAPNTYSVYADIAMETLLFRLKDKIAKRAGFELIETYSYARLYKNGDVLARHFDRDACALSATLHLGGDPWPIYLNPSNKLAQDGFKVNLKPGDLLIYRGDEMEHWREEFEGEISGQVFLHYNKINSPEKYDGRIGLGLPAELKQQK